jgi:FAD:protein FMN transferase
VKHENDSQVSFRTNGIDARRARLPVILLLTAGFGIPVESQTGTWIEREVRAMGTSLLVRVHGADAPRARAGAEAALVAVERADVALGTWSGAGPLMALRSAPPGSPVAVEPTLAELLHAVRALGDSTGGAFDPTLGRLIDLWDLRGPGRRPTPAALAEARAATGWRHFTVTPAGVQRLHAEAWIDSDGFGKGAALRAVRAALLAAGADAALVNFGGQILVVDAAGGPTWTVAVADPLHRDRVAASLVVPAGSVATTGQSERTIVVEADTLGHVLDPRSGMPVPAWGSVTVVDADPLRADVLSTALFVLGPVAGWAWAEDHRIAALFLERTSDGLEARVTARLRDVATVHIVRGGEGS